MSRASHLVGSVPAPDARTAMELALDHLHASIDMLPDGETGARSDWVQGAINSFASHPDLELKREGDWSGYDKTPVYRVRRGHALAPETLDFGYVTAFREAFPVFREVTAARGRGDLAFQVGIPGDFDMALFTLGPRGAFRGRAPFTEATARDIATIHAEAGDDVVFQIEVPAELIFVARMPGPLQAAMARYQGGVVAELARRAPAGARFGLHLCLGDMNHEARGRMKNTRPLVLLINAIARRWPAGRPLEFVHAPFAAAAEPPSQDASWYAPLAGLTLPAATRFIAGFAHEGQPLEVQRELRATIESAVGRPVDIATSCGLGRRSAADAADAMARTAALVG